MLTNAPVSPSIGQQAMQSMDRQEWESAQVALKALSATDDVEAVHYYLLRHPRPSLWVAFLENPAIQTRLNNVILQLMYDHYHALQIVRDFDPEWEVVHSLLYTLRHHFTTQKLACIANVRFNENFSKILDDVLSSKIPQLWFAFIQQPAILLGLRLEHYKCLIEKVSHYALTENTEHENWVILLTLYITKAYPATYQQMLSAWPAHFPIMLNLAVDEISKHCQSDESTSIPQTAKWLCFLLKLAEQTTFLTLWQQHPTFQNYIADGIKHLATSYVHQLVAFFPHQISTVLHDCKSKLATPGRHQRAVISLIRSLHDDIRFKRYVLADSTLCQAIGIVYVPEEPLKPMRVAPAAPQRSASLPPQFTPGYEHVISPQTHRTSAEVNIVSMLECMVLKDEKKNKPPI